ncbi:MAG: type II toxin-antitoxin system HicA family toxin [Saprospiraceae bacterium]
MPRMGCFDYSSPGAVLFLNSGNKFITFAVVKYDELFKLLKNDGWFAVRQNGSHVIMRHESKHGLLTLPYHAGKEV